MVPELPLARVVVRDWDGNTASRGASEEGVGESSRFRLVATSIAGLDEDGIINILIQFGRGPISAAKQEES